MTDCKKEKILIMGAGNVGFGMAAHFIYHGEIVNIWNRTPAYLSEAQRTGVIRCNKVLDFEAKPAALSSNIEDVLANRIFITTTAGAHAPIAKMLAPYINESTIIYLCPARTFGAIDFLNVLKQNNCKHVPIIAELASVVHATGSTRRDVSSNQVNLLSLKRGIKLAALNPLMCDSAMKALPECMREYITPVESVAVTSLENIGMMFHCAPMLMNIGLIEGEKSFDFYTDGISKSVAGFIEQLDVERLAVGHAFGYKVLSVTEWLSEIYKTDSNSLFEALRQNPVYGGVLGPKFMTHRYIEDDVPFGLVPLESAGNHLGVKTPLTTLLIDLACAVMNKDYRANGRILTKSIKELIKKTKD